MQAELRQALMNLPASKELDYVQDKVCELDAKITELEKQCNKLIDALKQILNVSECKCTNHKCIYCSAHDVIMNILE